jgi:predicted PurR-regulated permease PerM
MTSRRPAESDAPRFLVRLRLRRRAAASSMPAFDARTVAYLVAAALFAGLLWSLAPILAPFLAAAILAYIFDPLVNALARRGFSRSVATGIAVLGLLLLIVLLLLIILPLFYKEILQLTQQIPGFVDRLRNEAAPWLTREFGVDVPLDSATLKQFIADNAQDASGIIRRLFATFSVGGLAVMGFLINVLLVPVVLFYLLRDWPGLIRKVDDIVPRHLHDGVNEIAREIDAVLSEFLRGQLSVMVIMSVFYVTGLWLAGLNFALPVGLITGLLVFIPYLGSGTGFVLGTIAAVMQFPSMTGVIVVWLVFGLGQLLEGFFVTPRLVGERIGLHPVAVIFALLAFGQLFGFFGVLLALPASAALLVGLRHVGDGYRRSSLYRR